MTDLLPTEERRLALSCSEFASLDEALAWVVQRHDAEFAKATMVSLGVEQILRSGVDNDWRYVWTARIHGIVAEGVTSAAIGASDG